MNNPNITLPLIFAMMSSNSTLDTFKEVKYEIPKRDTKIVFTPEEIEQLSKLSGKEKKKYVKDLKERYRNI